MARGTIIKRKKKSGGVTYDIKYRLADGTQVKAAIGPRREAEEALTSALAAVNTGAVRKRGSQTLAEAADEFLAAKKPVIEASTYRDYEIHIRLRLKPVLGHLKLKDIRR